MTRTSKVMTTDEMCEIIEQGIIEIQNRDAAILELQKEVEKLHDVLRTIVDHIVSYTKEGRPS